MKKKRRAGKSEMLSLGCCLGILFKDSEDRAWPFWYSLTTKVTPAENKVKRKKGGEDSGIMSRLVHLSPHLP